VVLVRKAANFVDIQTQCFVDKQNGPCRSADHVMIIDQHAIMQYL